jgi:hypothetical protein
MSRAVEFRNERTLSSSACAFYSICGQDARAPSNAVEELEFIRRYLEIEKIRFEDRLTIRVDVARDVGDARVPTLALQPLIENAIHHGIASPTRARGWSGCTAPRSASRSPTPPAGGFMVEMVIPFHTGSA